MERGFGRTWLSLDGRQDVSAVVFWDERSLPLRGAATLETFGLGIDPVNGRLVPEDAYILAADSPRLRPRHETASQQGGALVSRVDSGAQVSAAHLIEIADPPRQSQFAL